MFEKCNSFDIKSKSVKQLDKLEDYLVIGLKCLLSVILVGGVGFLLWGIGSYLLTLKLFDVFSLFGLLFLKILLGFVIAYCFSSFFPVIFKRIVLKNGLCFALLKLVLCAICLGVAGYFISSINIDFMYNQTNPEVKFCTFVLSGFLAVCFVGGTLESLDEYNHEIFPEDSFPKYSDLNKDGITKLTVGENNFDCFIDDKDDHVVYIIPQKMEFWLIKVSFERDGELLPEWTSYQHINFNWLHEKEFMKVMDKLNQLKME